MRTEKHILEFSEADARKINPEGVYRRMLECHSCPLFEGDIKRIANAFGLGFGSMLAFIKQHGLDGRLEDEIMKKVDYDKVKALYDSGKTDAQITKELDISFATVYMWRQRHGFEKNEPAAAADVGILIAGNGKQTRRPTSDEIAAAIMDRKPADEQRNQSAKPAIAEITADGAARNKAKRDSLKIDFDKMLPKLAKPAKIKTEKPKRAAPEVSQPAMLPSEETTAGAIIQSLDLQALADDSRDDIDDMLHEWYSDRLLLTKLATGIERMDLEKRMLVAMLIGAGVDNVDSKLQEVIHGPLHC
jgi:hypothetical protein